MPHFTLIMKFIRIIGLTITVFNKSTFYIIISKFNELNFQIIVRLKLIHFGLKKLCYGVLKQLTKELNQESRNGLKI
jgi:hypothetical protein